MKRLNGLPGRLAVITLACVAGVAQADDQDVIDYRRHIMKTMGEPDLPRYLSEASVNSRVNFTRSQQ